MLNAPQNSLHPHPPLQQQPPPNLTQHHYAHQSAVAQQQLQPPPPHAAQHAPPHGALSLSHSHQPTASQQQPTLIDTRSESQESRDDENFDYLITIGEIINHR